jgi:DNA-binding NarL/FixJ family response regulator
MLTGDMIYMKSAKQPRKPAIRIVIVDSDPLRLLGFHAILESEPDFEFIYASNSNPDSEGHIDIILLGNQQDPVSSYSVAKLKALYADAQIIAIGSGTHDEVILAALACGAKGYVDERASAVEFIMAIRAVNEGSVWVSRHLLSVFVERACGVVGRHALDGSRAITQREKEVLEMLVNGRSNREIGAPLGIAVRTVKAHVARLMCKVGVRNRIALCTYAISHSLVPLVLD